MRRAAIITALVCLTPVVSHSIGRSLYGLMLVATEDDLGLTHGEAGVPSAAIFVFYCAGVLAVVLFSPRVEPISIMRAALITAGVGTVITAQASNLIVLAVGVGLVGGAGAGIWMTAPVLATAFVSAERRGLVIGFLTSTIGLANVGAGLLLNALRRSTGDPMLWRPMWWIALAFIATLLVGLATLARFPPSDRVATRGLDLAILRQVPRWKRLTIAYALFGGMSAGFGSFIVAALEEHGGLSSERSALTFSLMGVAAMVASPLAGAASDRFGRPIVLHSALGVLAIANIAVAIGGALPTTVGALLVSAGASTFPTLIATVVRDSLDQRAFSQALAMMTLLFSVTAAALPPIVGAIADATGSFRWPYLVVAVFPVAALATLVAPSSPETANPAIT
ncbi:MAG: MFS transporter [Actinomycetota bacterium]